jgi:hypothetical protein
MSLLIRGLGSCFLCSHSLLTINVACGCEKVHKGLPILIVFQSYGKTLYSYVHNLYLLQPCCLHLCCLRFRHRPFSSCICRIPLGILGCPFYVFHTYYLSGLPTSYSTYSFNEWVVFLLLSSFPFNRVAIRNGRTITTSTFCYSLPMKATSRTIDISLPALFSSWLSSRVD